jgi:succinoglycan biosynthesis protein ExoM
MHPINNLATIDVCIATFMRPAMLWNLLLSLQKQDLAGIHMRVIVVDNDREQSARKVVEDFRNASRFDVIYEVEGKQNISLARNRALCHVKSTYVAFIDDDESASRQWLRSLLDSLVKFDADVAFGPVLRTLPSGAPSWAVDCFRMQRRKTGEIMQFGGAGNVMLARSVVTDRNTRFSVDFGLTGGEDTEFFYRLFLAGRRLIWCDEAIVTEPVAESRLTLQWIRRRGFRGGQTYNRIFVSRYSRVQKVQWFAIKTAHLAGGLMVAPFLRLISYQSYVALTVRIAAACGQLSRCFSGENFEEYNIQH